MSEVGQRPLNTIVVISSYAFRPKILPLTAKRRR
jgi:hypothetical protein